MVGLSLYYPSPWWVTGPPRKSWRHLRHPWRLGPHPNCPNARSVRQPRRLDRQTYKWRKKTTLWVWWDSFVRCVSISDTYPVYIILKHTHRFDLVFFIKKAFYQQGQTDSWKQENKDRNTQFRVILPFPGISRGRIPVSGMLLTWWSRLQNICWLLGKPPDNDPELTHFIRILSKLLKEIPQQLFDGLP